MPVPTYEQIRGLDPVWLLELDLGGDVRRYATRETVTADGAVYRSGLELDTVTLDEGTDRISLVIQDPAEDWARYENRGGTLDMQIGVLRLWWPGMTETQGYGILKGRTSGARTGTPGQPGRLAVSLRGTDLDAVTLYPPAQAVVDRTTFSWDPANFGTVSNFEESAEGYVWPVPIGFPGTGSVDDSNPPAVYEVPLVTTTTVPDSTGYRVMVALGEIDADQVEITDMESEQGTFATLPRSSVLTVETATDLLGRAYSRVELPSAPGTTGINSTATVGPLAVSFRSASGWGGGVLNRERTGPLRGLGEVIGWCLEKSGVQADIGRQEAERGRLDAFKIDGLLCGGTKGRIDLNRFVSDELGALFPIRRVRTADGVWWRYQSFAPVPSDAVAYLSADRGEVQRTGDLKRTHGRYNRFLLRYASNLQRATRMRVLAPEHEVLAPYSGLDERIIGSSVCRASETLYGPREAPEVETDLVWDDKTAAAILREWSYRDALPYQTTSYEGSYLGWVTPGDVIAITDAEVGFSERLAIVDSVTLGGSVTTLGLIVPFSADVLTA